MDCESCTDRLVDLLEELVDGDDAEALQGHLTTCESCSAAFERMKAGRELASFMVLEEPPSAVRASVLAAARERAAGRASLRPEVVERPEQVAVVRETRRDDAPKPDDGEGGLWSSLMRWLGSLAMGPQVAMSMMLLLMVGIGLWYLPELRRHDPTDTHAILDPATGDEAGPSGALAPAEPLALDADPRTGRIRAREEAGEPPTERRVRPAAESRVAAAERPAAAVDEPAGGGEEFTGAPTDTVAEAPTDTIAGPPTDTVAGAPTDTVAGPPTDTVAGPPPPPVAQPMPERQRAQAQLAAAEAEGFEMDLAPGQALEGTPRVAPSAAAPPPTAPAYAAAPVEEAPTPAARPAARPMVDEGRVAEMVDRPTTDTRPLLPAALHQLARNQVRESGCAQAIGSYEQLLARHPSYSGIQEARIELADCYRRAGRISRARSLLELAARDPRVASRAQRELLRLEAAERAMNRAGDRPASQALEAPAD
jgi:hypothetical protein